MTNLFSYAGKRVVLTGGATGIGAALAELLGELGVEHLTILDIKAPTGRCDTFIEVNLADPTSIDAAMAQIEGPIDVLFSNAGVAANAGVRTCMAVNVAASRRLTDGLFDRITKGGTIVYTASMAGNGWPAQVAEIMPLLHANNLPPNVEVIAEGSPGEAIYFVASGAVTMRGRSGEERYAAGDVFGVAPTLGHDRHAAAFVTTSRARLLKLYREDLARLVAGNPLIGAQIRRMAASEGGEGPAARPDGASRGRSA